MIDYREHAKETFTELVHEVLTEYQQSRRQKVLEYLSTENQTVKEIYGFLQQQFKTTTDFVQEALEYLQNFKRVVADIKAAKR